MSKYVVWKRSGGYVDIPATHWIQVPPLETK